MSTAAERLAPLAADSDRDGPEIDVPRTSRRAKIGVVVVAILVVGVGVGWGTGWLGHSGILGAFDPPCAATVSIQGAGSTFIGPLMEKWANAFDGGSTSKARGCISVRVSYNASSGVSGLAQLSAKSTEFVATEEPLNTTATAQLAAPSLTLPFALGAVAVAYNIPGVAAGLDLTGQLLASIYLGEITAWNDPAIAAINPGVDLPSGLPITVIHGAPGSGMNYVFTGYLSLNNATWAARVGQGASVAWPTGLAAGGEGTVASTLLATSGGIAYLGSGAADAGGLTCANLQNPSGFFVDPSTAGVYAAASEHGTVLPLGNQSWQGVSLLDAPGNQSYPLTTFTYTIVYTDTGIAYGGILSKNAAQWLASFLYWISVNAQVYTTQYGYVPLPPAVIADNTQIAELIRYYGQSLGDLDHDGD
ncbi:MAG: phosphate ABC transporter substrate-binding protein PstS [Thermoplasmata archaeon]